MSDLLPLLNTKLTPRPPSLTFADSNAETQFNAEFRTNAAPHFRLLALSVLAFLIAISLTGLIVEFSVNRENIQRLLWFAMIPLTAVTAALLHTRSGSAHAQTIAVGYLVLMGAVCIGFPRVRGDVDFADSYGFSYITFLIFLVFPFSRLAPLKALLLALVLMAGYAVVMGTMPGLAFSGLHMHFAIMLGGMALGFAVGYTMEQNERRAFAARTIIANREQLLKEEKEKLAASEAKLQQAMAKSEALLLAMLPQSIAERLKSDDKSIADGIVECTVLFADLVGFTALAQELGPRALVSLLNQLFSSFDALAAKHGLEKIKTIGDAYMVAGGVPDYMENHAAAVADMALDMRECMAQFNRENDMKLAVRIGMHSGPVIAGVIGTRKFSYDLWGDAVNMAARMESHGEPGRIQVTDTAARLLRRTHALEERGIIEVKGKGDVRTFWLEGRSHIPGGGN